jgi:hypothetical protein
MSTFPVANAVISGPRKARRMAPNLSGVSAAINPGMSQRLKISAIAT